MEAVLAGGDLPHTVALPEEGRRPEILLLGRRVDGYGAQPWVIGQQYRIEDIDRVLKRLFRSIFVGVVILLVSVAVAFFVGRRIVRQICHLAAAAERLRTLEFAEALDVPKS